MTTYPTHLLTQEQRKIIWFCAKECELQRSGEVSVAWMLSAYEFAVARSIQEFPSREIVRVENILELGSFVEPIVNEAGFRKVGVRVGSDVKMPATQVWGAMTALLKKGATLTPEEWFFEYETIHPFRDGNGRTGAILYNWMRGSLLDPVWPPNFWNDPRRDGLRTAE